MMGRKSGLLGSKLDSQSKGRGFESCPLLDGNDVKVMPGSIPETPNPGLYSKEKKEILVAKWGTPKKNSHLFPKVTCKSENI